MNQLIALTINNKYTKFILVFVFVLISMLMINTPKANAAYDGGRLIDNQIFLDANSMNASQIQQFLVNKGAGLANLNYALTCGAPSDTATMNAYAAVSAPCGQTVPASSIIYYAAQIYGLSPRVILATMQKEQSLTTATNPTDWQINQAMGYDCPTTGGCSASNFFYQIDNGVWVLRYHYERARGNNTWWTTSSGWNPCGTAKNFYTPNLYPGQNVNFYDENGVLYRTHYLQNAATSALYCYTPHAYNNPQGLYGREPFGTIGLYYSGSYNFVYWFENWFGNTNSGQLLIAHPDGTLVRPAAGPNASNVYLLKDGGAAFATSLGVFQSHGFDFGQVKIATPGDLNLMAASDADIAHNTTPKPLSYREGSLIKGTTTNTVYVVQNISGSNRKKSLDSLENFIRLGYSFRDVITIPDTEIDAVTADGSYGIDQAPHPNGTLIRDASSPTVYYLINGERHSMTSGAILLSHRFKWTDVKIANIGDSQMPITWPVTWYGEGTMLKGSSPIVYIVDLDISGVNMYKRSFGTYYNFVGLDYSFKDVRLVSDSELPVVNGADIGL